MLFLIAFSCQVNIQLFFDIIRNLPRYRATLCVGHSVRKCNNKANILLHLSRIHNRHRIITIMNGCSVGGGNSCEGQCRNSLICKGCGITGVNILRNGYAPTQFRAQILQIMSQCFLGATAGNEFAHNATDHVQIDVQNDILQLVLVITTVGL